MLSNSGVNINDSLSVKGYLNAYYNAQFSYLAYQQVISSCATYAGSYVLPRKGTQADFVESGYRFGFNGMEKDDEAKGEGNSYDFGARIYDSRLGRWLSLDPLQSKYPSHTPYCFVNNMPIWAIDPDGKDVITLSDPDGAATAGHQAVLIGDEKSGGFFYISKDGFEGKSGLFRSKSKVSVAYFKTIEEFKNSPHNYVLEDGSNYSDKNPKFKLDENGKRIQRYTEAYRIKTDPKTDYPAALAGVIEAMKDYKLCTSDCSDVVTKVLEVAKTPEGKDLNTGERGIDLDFPRHKQQNIKYNNAGTDVDITPSQ